MTKKDIENLRTFAKTRTIDMGGGGVEIYVSHKDIVMGRDRVVELCDMLLHLLNDKSK